MPFSIHGISYHVLVDLASLHILRYICFNNTICSETRLFLFVNMSPTYRQKEVYVIMYATKIKMQRGCYYSQNLLEIDEIYIEGCDNPGFFKKSVIHEYLKEYPGSIQVKVYPYPEVVPAVSINGEKYVRSSPNSNERDNLLSLPREYGGY